MRIKSNAADLRKWGDGIKYLYASPTTGDNVVFGIKDYTVYIYATNAAYYPSLKSSRKPCRTAR